MRLHLQLETELSTLENVTRGGGEGPRGELIITTRGARTHNDICRSNYIWKSGSFTARAAARTARIVNEEVQRRQQREGSGERQRGKTDILVGS